MQQARQLEEGSGRIACQAIGQLDQFFFLASFAWISIMSYENKQQLQVKLRLIKK